MDHLFVFLGLVILLLAGDSLVRGAVNASLRLGVPALIVSLTIVAFGTSAPELLIAIKAVDEQTHGLAIGNVVGSNIANVLLVLGVPALIARMGACDGSLCNSFLLMLGATALFMFVAYMGPITWVHGALMVFVLVVILGAQMRAALVYRRDCREEKEEDVEGADPSMSWRKILIFLGLGLVGLPLGADMLVDGAGNIARKYGVSDTLIGLTIVAIGTSLPELATTVMAAIRRHADVALGNVVGSNMFNLLAIIGIASFFGDIPVDPKILSFDLWVMLGASMLLAPFAVWPKRFQLSRRYGLLFVALYGSYLTWLIV